MRVRTMRSKINIRYVKLHKLRGKWAVVALVALGVGSLYLMQSSLVAHAATPTPTVRATTTAYAPCFPSGDDCFQPDTFSVAKPAGTLSTDRLIAIQYFWGPAQYVTTPAGFTKVAQSTATDPLITVFSAPGSVATPYNFTAWGYSTVAMSAISGADATNPITVTPVFGHGGPNVAAQVCPAITPTVDNTLLMCGAGTSSFPTRSYTAPAGMTMQANTATNAVDNTYVAVATQGLSGGANVSTGTRTLTANGSVSSLNAFSSVGVVVNPVPPPAPTGLKAYTGGANIALNWDANTPNVRQYNIYRNGTQIATTHPDTGAIDSKYYGDYYDDQSVSDGNLYNYKVQVINTGGQASPLSPVVGITHRATTTPLVSVTTPTGTTDLAPWANNIVIPEIKIWYPKLVKFLAENGYATYISLAMQFDPNYAGGGIAYTAADNHTMVLSADYFRANPWDVSSTIHETVHMIQDMHYYATERQPAWAQEGMADWGGVTYFNRAFGGAYAWNPPSPTSHYADGYEVSADFMQWISKTYNLPNFVRDLNLTTHNNAYDDNSFFLTRTGQTVEQLWKAYSGRNTSTHGAVYGVNGWCMESLNFGVDNGTPIDANTCSSNSNQEWLFDYNPGSTTTGSVRFQASSSAGTGPKCLDVSGAGTVHGTPVQLWDCNGGIAQQWQKRADGSWFNPNSGKCLDTNTPTAPTQIKARLQIWDCNGLAWQTWNGIVPMGQIINVQSGSNKCVDDQNYGTANANPIQIYDCLGNTAQQFHFVKNASNASGTYRAFGTKCMEVANLATANDTPVQIWDCNGGAQQEWTVWNNGTLRNTLSGKCLQPLGGNITNSTRMVVDDCDGRQIQGVTVPVYAP